jgi:glycosyltransferase involved in cell wall biosynthesis
MHQKDTFPTVSVICLCYNHHAFVARAIDSVLYQNHANFELIVVNDCSSDNSTEIILNKHDDNFIFIDNKTNLGMCKSFNNALAIAKGKYIIDLAADDFFEPDKLFLQVKCFESLPENYGVVYSDANLYDDKGVKIGTFNGVKKNRNPRFIPPQGNVFARLLGEFCIMTPTIMVRKTVFDELGGYDPSLSYEDYDFFLRSSRKWHYHFIDKALINRTILEGSSSQTFFKVKNDHLVSTLKILEKILPEIRTQEEKKILAKRLKYFIRACFYTHHWGLSHGFKDLLSKVSSIDFMTRLFLFCIKLKIPINKVYLYYLKRYW